MSLHAKPNDIHQADILYLPHDKYGKKIYKYALNIVDIAIRYKGSYQLTTKSSKEVAQAFQWIYGNTLLTYPKTLIINFFMSQLIILVPLGKGAHFSLSFSRC